LPFVFPDDLTAEQVVAQLSAQGWRGEIIGPHGSGKSSLLEALKPALESAGCRIQAIALRDGQRWLPRGFAAWERDAPAGPPQQDGAAGASPSHGARRLMIVDGYEQLGCLQRLWLKRRCRRASAGLLVTSHAPTGLPTLVTLVPDVELVQRLVARLARRAATRITPADVAASHAVHGSNVREILFDLYDRHERHRHVD
jgi:hypothetical protein